MKRTIASLLFLIGLSFAVTTYADVVTYFNDFSVGKVAPGSQAKWSQTTDLRPWYSNLRYYKTGGNDNLRFDLGTGFIKQASGTGSSTTQMDASRFLSTATAYDLTAGDLVYECWYACDYNGVKTGSFHQGISINDNQMLFIYHPGYQSGTMMGAFRVEGKISNQSIGFVPPIGNSTDSTMMKLTIHRDEAAGNYVFTTQFGLASSGEYTYSHIYTCPLATFDDVGGIKSIGPYNYKENNAVLRNLTLVAPFSDAEFAKAQDHATAMETVISAAQPVHWYKFDDRSTNVIADYGSSPVEGAGVSRNVDMSAISELHQVADFSGNNSKVDLTGTDNITGDWTAEFYINPHNISGRQALVSGNNGSLRWIMNSGKPGFTKWGAYDAEFKGPDGTSAFSYDLSQIVDKWTHVAYVRQGNDLFLYINGELVGKNASNQPAIDMPISRTIGSNGDGEAFAGIIDDIALYSSAMTAEQIWKHAFPESIWYYNVNTTDMSADSWTIDGTDKRGAWFIRNGESNTETYDKQVILNGDGSFEIDTSKNLTLSGVVSGSGALEKIGAGALTLSGNNDYTGNTTVSEGKLILTGDGIKANSSIEIAKGATLEYYVPEGEKQLTFSDATVSGENVIKTGEGKLKILATGDQFQSDLFTVEAGELDFKGQYTGDLVINEGAVFSPGNSVGHVDVDGKFTLVGGTLLIEMDESGFDTMSANSFDLDNGMISFTLTDDIPWGSSYDLLTATSGEEFEEGIIDRILNGQTLPYYFSLYLAGDGNIVRMDIDRNAVPEPSTWALMILGAAGLLYWRKRK
ncbi:MAG: autotransporter-associated beta strand repeat-containing protein [Thermoguttaceae bacterium]|nr:autotransporter-associated beta strand repeat-containing protein [Thermoguttaceae bacterium]